MYKIIFKYTIDGRWISRVKLNILVHPNKSFENSFVHAYEKISEKISEIAHSASCSDLSDPESYIRRI